MAQLIRVFDAVGIRCADPRVGLDDDGIADLRKKLLSGGERRDLRETCGGNVRLFVKGLHRRLIFDVIHIACLPACADVEVRAQARIALKPVLVVGLEPVNAPIFEGKECDGTQHLIVVGE